MQFVHSLLPVFRNGLKSRRNYAFYGSSRLQTRKEQSEYDGGRVRNHRRPGLQFRRRKLPKLPLNPRGSQCRAGFVLKRVRKINNRAAGFLHLFPTSTSALRVRSKEGEVDLVELLCANALNKSDLFFYSLQLTERLVVIE